MPYQQKLSRFHLHSKQPLLIYDPINIYYFDIGAALTVSTKHGRVHYAVFVHAKIIVHNIIPAVEIIKYSFQFVFQMLSIASSLICVPLCIHSTVDGLVPLEVLFKHKINHRNGAKKKNCNRYLKVEVEVSMTHLNV